LNNVESIELSSDLEQKSFSEVFSFLGDEALKSLGSRVTEVKLEQDMFLFEVGDSAGEAFFLARGRLSVQKQTGFHRKMQVVALLEPGAVVGEAGLLPGRLHAVSVRAIEPSLLYRLDRQQMEELERTDPPLLIQLLRRFLYISSLRLEKTTERLAHVL
jgi:CRP/FNR family transcriptional regulator, cyclic AMP receptor protein